MLVYLKVVLRARYHRFLTEVITPHTVVCEEHCHVKSRLPVSLFPLFRLWIECNDLHQLPAMLVYLKVVLGAMYHTFTEVITPHAVVFEERIHVTSLLTMSVRLLRLWNECNDVYQPPAILVHLKAFSGTMYHTFKTKVITPRALVWEELIHVKSRLPPMLSLYVVCAVTA